jgi:succinate dehydrogenase flavin-adding protein (antitoxin of CptAB toxin-antitoxin module)
MSSELTLETFRYFIECHFNIDRDYSELEKVILEFKEMEYPEYSVKLLKEAKSIIKLDDWQYIHDFIYKYGLRNYDKDRLIKMIWAIIKVLSD